jgi:hypothetical protein
MVSQNKIKQFFFLAVSAVLLLGFENCSDNGFNSVDANSAAQKNNSGSAAGTPFIATPVNGVIPVNPLAPGAVPVPSIAGAPVITGSLAMTNNAAGVGANLLYTISNLNNASDSYSIGISGSSMPLKNIYGCHDPNQSDCSVFKGTEFPFLFSTYLFGQPSGQYNLEISASNSRGTALKVLSFNYQAPASAPVQTPMATPTPAPAKCVRGYWDEVYPDTLDIQHICIDNSAFPLPKITQPGPPEVAGNPPALVFDKYSTKGNPSGVSYRFTNMWAVGDSISIDVTDSHGFVITNIYRDNNTSPGVAGIGVTSGLRIQGILSFTLGFDFSYYLPGQPAGTYQIRVEATNHYASRSVYLPFQYTP